MHFTRPRELIFAGLLGLGLGYLLFESAYGRLPRLPVAAGATLLVLAVVELPLAFSIRNRIRTGRVVAALAIARAVALAKASSLVGAFMLGAWSGAVIFLLPKQGRLSAAASDLPAAFIGAACAAALVAAALWLEHCCRTPRDQSSDWPHRPAG